MSATALAGDEAESSARSQGAALCAASSLVLFNAVVQDEVGQAVVALLDALAAEQPSEVRVRNAFGTAFSLLALEHELEVVAQPGDAWQAHLMSRVLEDTNPFSLKAQAAPLGAMGPALLAQARVDLRALQVLHSIGAAQIARLSSQACAADAPFPSWDGLTPLGHAVPLEIVATLRSSSDWGEAAEALAHHYAARGTGAFARFLAFRWSLGAELEGLAHPESVRLEDLVGYEQEHESVVRNTERFVAGYPANNALLYGDRGTGKSSTVKALLDRFSDGGLRLVEVPKEALADFPRLIAVLRGRRERFIIFVDDLSFEEHETAYKGLKAILEGGLEARPENVLLYATSNRRHLVRQRFGDRDSAPDDIHPGDTVEEKLSLADRFGLRVRFMAPDQARYLAIASALARRRGISLEHDDLEKRALRWAARHGGRSPRTARQFVDSLEGELALP